MSRKQQLLKRHRRNKRIGLLIALIVLIALGVLVAWWLPLVLALIGWVAHEAWFADHLFYSPKDDYQYSFPPFTPQPKVHLNGEQLRLDEGVMLVDDATLILAVKVKSSFLGRFFDPRVELVGGTNPDAQTFERGVNGLRYLNLSGQAQALSQGQLRLRPDMVFDNARRCASAAHCAQKCCAQCAHTRACAATVCHMPARASPPPPAGRTCPSPA